MKKKYNVLIVLMLMLAFVVQSCEKEGQLVVVPISKLSPIEFSGFVLVDTLEQYFDGKKMREFHDWARFTGNIAFEGEAPVKMELRKKSTGETVFSQTIDRDAPAKPITFFYDGKKVSEKYEYPDPIDEIEQIAFYFDFPADSLVDIAYGDGSDINSVEYLAKNVKPGQWTEHIKIPPLEGEMYILFLRAGKKEWLMDNDINFSIVSAGLTLPNKYGYLGGGVQSWYLGRKKDIGLNKDVLYPQINLVQIFPK